MYPSKVNVVKGSSLICTAACVSPMSLSSLIRTVSFALGIKKNVSVQWVLLYQNLPKLK